MDRDTLGDADTEADSQTVSLAHRLAFLEMSSADRTRLKALAPRLKASSHQFVESFYKHLFGFEETARFLQDPLLVDRLKQMQQAHLQSMLEDDVDEKYVVRRRRVGDVHAHVGISPQMFLGAYNQYLQYGLRRLATDNPGQSPEFVEDVLSLLKAIFLDIELTLDAYFSQATQNLRQALEMLFRANTELRQFAQLTSHDLKTPLATVANLCDETLDEFGDQMPPEACRLVELARQRTFRMSKLIDELLELSAPATNLSDNGTIETQQVIAEALERLAGEIKLKQVQVSLTSQLPTTWGNPVRLREAVFNILSNAVKFIDKQPARIRISAEADDHSCTLAIEDNGPGIPEDELDRIFSAFRRLKTHHDTPGSGLGLYFSRYLVEQDGGRVWAKSELGRGSTFFLALRRHG